MDDRSRQNPAYRPATEKPRSGGAFLCHRGAVGVRIAIDDFGIGYSALASLRHLALDAIKIDRSLISGIRSKKESVALMRTLIQPGKTIGLETLGEGIEEPGQLDRLRRERCDSGQGFLFARPLDAEQIEQFLSLGPTRAAASLSSP